MTRLAQFFQNKVLWTTLLAWLVAQVLKIFVAFRRQGRFDLKWFMGTGGMPSAHSAGVSALAAAVGLQMGFHTAAFAVALMFALVTMFDAQGVRRSVGRQTVLLNRILDELYMKGQVSEGRLKELLGHTPIEVIAGAVVGCVTAILMSRG
jgi:acid phosphatase family membrane protein YuiD